MSKDKLPIKVFKDEHNVIHSPDISLAFVESIMPDLEGTILRLFCKRGDSKEKYNTRLYTNRNEEVWLSGFTCGKSNAGTFGLCELMVMLGWDSWIPRELMVKIVLSNNKFMIQFEGPGHKLVIH